MDGDPQPDRGRQRRPQFGGQCLLEGQRRRRRRLGLLEDRERAVALPPGFHQVAAVGGDDLPDDGVVSDQGFGHRRRGGFPEPARTGDVGEQERHDGGRRGHAPDRTPPRPRRRREISPKVSPAGPPLCNSGDRTGVRTGLRSARDEGGGIPHVQAHPLLRPAHRARLCRRRHPRAVLQQRFLHRPEPDPRRHLRAARHQRLAQPLPLRLRPDRVLGGQPGRGVAARSPVSPVWSTPESVSPGWPWATTASSSG